MKKNIAMRVAAFLFILTMISTCAFATTFAKYTTTGSATDSARVAKWGVKVEAKGKNGSVLEIGSAVTDPNDEQIMVDANEKNIAPGSYITFVTFDIQGTPEVDVNFVFEVDLSLTGWSVGGTDYCPLEFKVGSATFKVGENGIADVDALETAVENYITTTYSVSFEAGTPLSTDLTISCSWAYEGNDDDNDTALGNAAAKGTGPAINLKMSCTVIQAN